MSRLAAIAALSLLTAAVYANSFTVGFPFDNKQLILRDPRVHEVSRANFDLILQHSYWWPYGESGLYRPITTLSYQFNYALLGNGERPAGYHALNLAVHLVNVLLFYLLVRRLRGTGDDGDAPRVALAAAAVWAVHPLSTEAVTNIVGRADLFAATAVLGGLLMYVAGRRASGAQRVWWFTGLLIATTVGVFSKESAIAIAPAIVVSEIACWDPRRSVRALTHAALAVAPPLLLMWWQRAAVLGTAPAAEFAFIDNPITGANFWTGRLTAIVVLGRYLRLAVWPATLSSDYSYAQIPLAHGAPAAWIACAAVTAIAGAAIALWRTGRAPSATPARSAAFFLGFAFVSLLPASNLLFASGTIMAERLMYLPLAGLIAAAVIGVFAATRMARVPIAAGVIVAVAVAGLSWRTWRRNPDWRDDVTLWSATVEAAPDSAKAHRALAEALYDADPSHGNLDRVIAEAERSVTLLASLPDGLNSYQSFRQLGAYHLDRADQQRREGARDEAARGYRRALDVLQRGLAIIHASGGQAAAASSAPEADVNRLLAAAHLGLGDPARALDAANRARALGPLSPLVYRLAADALLGQRRADEAAVALMVGSIVTGDAGLNQALIGLYRSGLDAAGCATVETPGGPILNPRCAIVREHVCRASAEAADVNVRLGRRDQADRARAFAATELGCR